MKNTILYNAFRSAIFLFLRVPQAMRGGSPGRAKLEAKAIIRIWQEFEMQHYMGSRTGMNFEYIFAKRSIAHI